MLQETLLAINTPSHKLRSQQARLNRPSLSRLNQQEVRARGPRTSPHGCCRPLGITAVDVLKPCRVLQESHAIAGADQLSLDLLARILQDDREP